MAESILQKEKCCHVKDCGRTTDLHLHHVFGGPNRKHSDADGLTIWLCADHHTGDGGVHFNREMDLHFKEEAERAWLRHYGKTIEQFRRRYGKNYL